MLNRKLEFLQSEMLDISEKIESLTRLKIDGTPSDIMKIQDNLKILFEILSGCRSTISKLYDIVRMDKLVTVMEANELSSISVDGVGRCNIQSDVFASIISGQKELALDFLHNEGLADMITETVNASSLKSLAKKRIKENNPLPDEIFKVTPYSYAKITRKK